MDAADTVCVLSVDGGGLRGLAAAKLLTFIDAMLLATVGKGVVDCFDVFAGTSTGSIIAAGMAASKGGRLDLRDPARIVEIYTEQAPHIFGPRPSGWNPIDASRQRWDQSGLERALADVFGELKLAEVPGDLIIPYYNMGASVGESAVIARGGPSSHDESVWANAKVREVVQASCSAPTYFNPYAMSGGHIGVDGGVFANNPAMIAWTSIQRRNRGARVLMLSIGCGIKSTGYSKPKTWGLFEWLSPSGGVPIIDVLMRGQGDLVDSQMKVVLQPEETYFRYQFVIDGLRSKGMDDSKPEALTELIGLANAEAAKPTTVASISKLASLLGVVHGARAARTGLRA